ncbi:MAG: MFS transporter [Granulosicoccus sp.]
MSTAVVMPWRIVLAACVGMFAATSTGSTRSPFLPDMAADLSVSLPAIANLFGITAASWGISSYLTGYASDRFGRRGFLILPPLLLSLAMLAVAFAQGYVTLVFITVIAGMCCGALTASVMTEVSIQTPVTYQGRALGYVMSGQSLTLLIGVPFSAWLGAMIGWRGIHVVLAGLALVASATMVVALIKGKGNAGLSSDSKIAALPPTAKSTMKRALTGPVIRLFIALIAERLCFGLATFYYASYLRTEYRMPIDVVAVPLITFAAGNILGTFVGGQVADKLPFRRVSFAVSILIAGCVAVPWFSWRPGIATTVALGVAFAFFNGISRPPLLAALADVPREVRGLIMGLNSSVASIGWLGAALLGGWFYAGIGFSGFSPLMASMCLLAALVVVPDSRLRRQYSS